MEVSQHKQWMQRCLELARKGAGAVSPNPMVGAVIVSEDGEVLGEGYHERYGEAHAERNAIDDARRQGHGDALRKAMLYVNLEPCSHEGRTPPCTDAIIESGIPKVVVGSVDSNPKVTGGGIGRLRSQNVEVIAGILEAACNRLNEAFFHHASTGRPFVTLKTAQTLDGQVATQLGDSQWISGEASRTLVHQWRAEQDAVMVGRGTALTDDPALTVRLTSGRQPYRIVVDREARLPASLKLFRDEHVGKTIAVVDENAGDPAYASDLNIAGGRILRVPSDERYRLHLKEAFAQLGAGLDGLPPIQSILVEAGPTLATSLLRQGLADRVSVFIAPMVIGSGTPAVMSLDIDLLRDALSFDDVEWQQVGDDMLFSGRLTSGG